MDSGQRQFTGVAVKGYKAALQQLNLLEQVRQRLPPETDALIERPPLPITWVDGRHIDRVLEAVAAIAGDEKVVEVALVYMRGSIGPVLGPLVKTTLGVFGSSPAMLLSRFDQIVRVVLKGVSSTLQRDENRAVTLKIMTVEPAARAWFISEQAVLLYACELCGAEGRIEGLEFDPSGMSATYRIRW